MRVEEKLEVKCGDKEGKLFNSVVTCICDACCEEREEAGGGGTFSLNAFEHHAGRGNRKKWKDSIRVKETGQSLGAWMAAHEQRGGGHDLRHPPRPGQSGSQGGSGSAGGAGGRLAELAAAVHQRQLLSPLRKEGLAGEEAEEAEGEQGGLTAEDLFAEDGSPAPSAGHVAAAMAAAGDVAGGELGPAYASGSLGSEQEEGEEEDEGGEEEEGDDEAAAAAVAQRTRRQAVEAGGAEGAERQQRQQQEQDTPAAKRPRGRPRQQAAQAEEEEEEAEEQIRQIEQQAEVEHLEPEAEQQQQEAHLPAAKRPRKEAAAPQADQEALPPPPRHQQQPDRQPAPRQQAPARCSLSSFQQLEDGDGVLRGAQLSLLVGPAVYGGGRAAAGAGDAGDASLLLFERLAGAAAEQGLNLMSFTAGAPSDQGLLPVDLELWLPPEAHASLTPQNILAFVRSLLPAGREPAGVRVAEPDFVSTADWSVPSDQQFDLNQRFGGGAWFYELDLAANIAGRWNCALYPDPDPNLNWLPPDINTPLYSDVTDDSNHGTHTAGSVNCMAICRNEQPGMKVVSMSIGGSYSESVRGGVEALRTAGILLVASAGNDGRNLNQAAECCRNYPASYTYDNVNSATFVRSQNTLFSMNYPNVADIRRLVGFVNSLLQYRILLLYIFLDQITTTERLNNVDVTGNCLLVAGTAIVVQQQYSFGVTSEYRVLAPPNVPNPNTGPQPLLRREFGVRNSFTKISICVPLAVVVRPSLGFGSSVELVDEAETLAALEVHESRGVLYVEAAMAFLTSRVVKVTIKMPSFALRSIVKTHQGSRVYVAPGFLVSSFAATINGTFFAKGLSAGSASVLLHGHADREVHQRHITNTGINTAWVSGVESRVRLGLTRQAYLYVEPKTGKSPHITGTVKGSSLVCSTTGRCSVTPNNALCMIAAVSISQPTPKWKCGLEVKQPILCTQATRTFVERDCKALANEGLFPTL
ncbi:DNA-directed RNA polymerase II subunit RPB1 [Micractinium conductrix]|uniref:DNA-directed RNA polymerase II subunit RPB1 n=1 Tax=Micractinium conductrix TaxID=554055 RepID=A0A2P6UZY8_9CHLO|nr:DNA-directed RNA polymerase II subunit RPB1 [Micractinium conductrix]|eukprot:PSC67402.1 DNA-directed RNA polymerase II subunit RPB1 [Micractinium conductrix]